MTATTAPDACECCTMPVQSVEHFTDPQYPRGSVLCRVCWRDALLSRVFGVTVECSRSGDVQSIDLVSGQATTVTPDGATTTTPTRPERVAWLGPGPTPDHLRPATDPHNERSR